MIKYLFFLFTFLFIGCAQIEPLQGGSKDTYAPAIDSLKSYPYNGQLNYTRQDVKLRFNEFIKLKNELENIIIVPKPKVDPIIKAKNKTLTIEFQEALQSNTTYNITFNGAIQDFTEGNDSVFQYVFSTGDYIDSLFLNGNVKDAFTNKADPGVIVGLYVMEQPLLDSVPILQKPYYLTQTKEDGSFSLNYLKAGTYALFAFQDLNKNLKLDPTEKRAFFEQQVILPLDDEIELKTFKEAESDCVIEDTDYEYPGKLTIVFSAAPERFEVKATQDLIQDPHSTADSLIYWLSENPKSEFTVYSDLSGELDTLKPIMKNIPDKPGERELKQTNNVLKGKLLPEENLKIEFTDPISAIDTSAIKFYSVDSVLLPMPKYKIDATQLTFETFGTAGQNIVIDSAAIKSVFGLLNKKEINVLFENYQEDYFGNLILTCDTVFSQNVMVELLRDGTTIDIRNFQEVVNYERLLPGDYQLRLIFDENEDGEWTTGELHSLRSPENMIYFEGSVQVKSKWDKEIDWRFKE